VGGWEQSLELASVFVRLTLKLGLAPLYPLQHVLEYAGTTNPGAARCKNLWVASRLAPDCLIVVVNVIV
jgi:hypothetical protein